MTSIKSNHLIGSAAIFAALAISSAAVLAAPADVVTARSKDAAATEFGRANANSYWQHREVKPLPEPIVSAYDKSKEFVVGAAVEAKQIVTAPPTVPPDEPQRYGRAGGFIGVEKFEVPQAGIAASPSQSPNAVAVKTGESQWGYAANSRMKHSDTDAAKANPLMRQDSSASAPKEIAPTPADKFNQPDSAHSQPEIIGSPPDSQ